LYNDVFFAAIRCALNHITIPQARFLQPFTSAQYDAYCRSHSIKANTEPIYVIDGSDVIGHWLGSPDAQHVILYLHGGGYTQPVSEANLRYLHRLVDDLNSERSNLIAVFILAYTLVPEARYPTQLKEAAAALSHLISKSGRSPSSIIISGDSAGGNLALSLLSHIIHPHPDVSTIKLERPLGGALLYSPWTGFSTDFASYDNVKFDMMSPLVLRKWSAMFLNKSNPADPEADPGPISGDAYTEACKNPASWWKNMDQTVGDIFVSYGSNEVLADPIRVFEKQLRDGWSEGGGDSSRITFVEGMKEAHVAPIFDTMAPGRKAKSSTQVAVEKWYKARLQI
jgi:acetyl esterase/lipase